MSVAGPARTPHGDVPTGRKPAGGRVGAGLFDPGQLLGSFPDAVRKLDPRVMAGSPVMFVVLAGSVLTTVLAVLDPADWFGWAVAAWLWLTTIFANLAEAVAEGRGKAQADTLRRARTGTVARRLDPAGAEERVPGADLRVGDLVVCEAGDAIPGDGDVVPPVTAERSPPDSRMTGADSPVIADSSTDATPSTCCW
ncbi:hypothetical protein [Streptomyces sp. I6]|uniref:hypothetical protein n=1 Tax=Streptomyces sp. I6 TaxID=2483113 RepID=UPI000F446CE5|nr:hypothetical protein EBF04_24850 [Streptomyces sp. I6]